MAKQRPLVLDLNDGLVKRLDPSFDVLDAKIEASDVLGLDEAIDDRVSILIKDSVTVVWTYLDSTDELKAEIRPGSITNEHVATDAAIAWSKIDKTGSSLVHLTSRYHGDLQGIQGDGQYHLSKMQHFGLTHGDTDASVFHHHDTRYYTKTQLQSDGQAQVHWGNITNKPSTFPPAPHTHPPSEITGFTEAAQDAVGGALQNSDTIELIYDDANDAIRANLRFSSTDTVELLATATEGLRANVRLATSPTVQLQATSSGVQADVRENSLTDFHVSTTANIAWSKISKAGSSLGDLGNVAADATSTGQALVFDASDGLYHPQFVLTLDHRTLTPIDHPDGSVTEPKLADNAVTARVIAANVDVSGKGFNADKVDGKDVNDLATDDSSLWTAAKIIAYVSSVASSSAAAFQDPVKDKDLCSPPASPATGDRYIVCSSGATGDWVGHENDVAEWDGSAWTFQTPSEGWVAWVEDEDKYYVYDGSQWKPWSSNVSHENLADLQGGQVNEHYHLTASQYSALTANQQADGLHYHSALKDETGNQALVVSGSSVNVESGYELNVPDPANPSNAVNLGTLQNWQHNNLAGLQGGSSAEYYHLTAAEYSTLQASSKVRVFDGLSLSGGRYLKTRFPMLASKDFVRVYENGSLLEPAAWDFDLGSYRCGYPISDLTDTILLHSPNASAVYTVEYVEHTCGYVPKIGLARGDEEFVLTRINYIILSEDGYYYYLQDVQELAETTHYQLTYARIDDPSVTKVIDKKFPYEIFVQGFPKGVDLSPWRLEVWKVKPRTRSKPRKRVTSLLPKAVVSHNVLNVFSGDLVGSNKAVGAYRILLRLPESNLVTQLSDEVFLIRRLRVLSNDGLYVGTYHFLEIR